jgi:hypothetical protein
VTFALALTAALFLLAHLVGKHLRKRNHDYTLLERNAALNRVSQRDRLRPVVAEMLQRRGNGRFD